MPSIKIRVSGSGVNKKAYPQTTRTGTNLGQTVRWYTNQNLHFAVHFSGNSPFDVLYAYGDKANDVNLDVKYDPDVSGARAFKYTIAVWDGTKVHISDPEIIIPPNI